MKILRGELGVTPDVPRIIFSAILDLALLQFSKDLVILTGRLNRNWQIKLYINVIILQEGSH